MAPGEHGVSRDRVPEQNRIHAGCGALLVWKNVWKV